MKKSVFLVSVFIFVFIIFNLTSDGHTPYDYFTRLSDSFLQGKYYLTQNPPWLNELVPGSQGKYFVVYPPMPAIVAIPFRLLFKENFYQEYLAQLLGAGIVTLTMLISWKIKKDKLQLIWIGLFTAFGNILWYLSATGSSWYLGQVCAAFFLTAAIHEAVSKNRPFSIGVLLGASYLARLQTILSLPLFLYFLFDNKDWLKRYFLLGLGLLPFVAFDFYYNFIRFGVIYDKGYYLIPGVLDEPWYRKGIFDLSYVLPNLKVLFLSLPNFRNQFPYLTPSWAGLSIAITSPAFVYAFKAKLKSKLTLFSWVAIILIAFLIFIHGGTGFTQFGYRYAVDLYPILIFLLIRGVSNTGVKWHHWLLLTFSILVNLWGVLWINKFGWVSF